MGTPFNPLPLAYAPTIDYLGVVMSYGAFERHSMEKRLHAAKANQAQLAKFLYGRKGLTQTHRISVCRTCVRSAATYGLPAVSLTHKSLKALHAFELKTLRAIARSPRHITHETSQDLYTRTGLQPIAEVLQTLLKRRIKELETPSQTFPGCPQELQWQQAVNAELRDARPLLQYSTLTPFEGQSYPCPECVSTLEISG